MPEQKQIADFVADARNGDPAAFESLYAAYDRRVYYFCRRLTAEDRTAAEVMRDTFVYAKRNLRSMQEGQTFLRWICGNAFYFAKISLASTRGESVTIAPPDGSEYRYDELQKLPHPGEEPSVRRSDLEAVDDYLDRLPDSERISLLLHDFVGFNAAETASIIGCDTDAVKAHVVNARLHLQALLEERAPGSGAELLPFIPRLLKTCGKICVIPESVSAEIRSALNAEEEDLFASSFQDDEPEDRSSGEGVPPGVLRALWIVAGLLFVGAVCFAFWFFTTDSADESSVPDSGSSEMSFPVESEPVSSGESVISDVSVPEESKGEESSEPAESSEQGESSESSQPQESSSSPTDIFPRAQTNLNLRDQPSTDGKALIIIPGGTHVNILDTVTNDKNEKWYKVSFTDVYGNEHTGYCSADYIEFQ